MTTFTARTPLDLIALVPYVLGFHPEDSVVLLTFAGKGAFHARVDLPDHLDDQQQVTRMLQGVLRQHRVPRVAVLVYSSDVEAAESQARHLLDALLDDGVEVVDVLRVDGEHFFECPDRGLPGTPYDLSAHPFTAERVFEGKVAHESRSALADTLVGVDEADADEVQLSATRSADLALVAAGADRDGWLHDQGLFVRGIVRSAARSRRRLSSAEAGQLLAAVAVDQLRDVAWAAMSRDNAPRHVELWSDLVRRCPRDLLPGAAGLLAFAAWLAGDGALSWCALDRCFEVDPDYSMGHTVVEVLENAVSPQVWEQIPEVELSALRPLRPPRRRAG